MHPVLFQSGSFTIYTYGVLVAAGVLLGLCYARRQAPRAGLDPDSVWNLGIYMVLAGLLMAKLWLVLEDGGYYWAHPRELLSITTLQAGGTFYGAVLGALLVLGLYTWFAKIPLLPLMDTYAFAAPLGHAIGRVGCFAAGCCYGKPTWLPWGVTFTSATAHELVGTPLNISLHPTQLYEAFAEFINLAILIWMGRRQKFTGQIIATYLFLYGVERFAIEFLRGDPGRTLLMNGAFSLMQVVSLLMMLTGAWLWWHGAKHPQPMRAAVAARR
jgi:phosphatidylglycerol---prolipoprotein diacylglyceryl transferase